MLEIGQEVFTLCRFGLEPFVPPYRYRIYISKKTINSVCQAGDELQYIAGKHGELVFHEKSTGVFAAVDKPRKPVFLTYEEAKKVQLEWIEDEKARRAKYEKKEA